MLNNIRDYFRGILFQQLQLDRIEGKANLLIEGQKKIMANFDALNAEMANLSIAEDDAIALMQRLLQMATADGSDQATIDSLTSQLAALRQRLADATTANTPPTA